MPLVTLSRITETVSPWRKRGNEATHEIKLMSQTDAKELLTFIEMLLRFVYEFPAMVPASGTSTT